MFIIYCLRNDQGQRYIGSTKAIYSIKKRLTEHKSAFKAWNKNDLTRQFKPYCSSYEIFKGTNVQIEELDIVSDRSVEKEYIKLNKCTNARLNVL